MPENSPRRLAMSAQKRAQNVYEALGVRTWINTIGGSTIMGGSRYAPTAGSHVALGYVPGGRYCAIAERHDHRGYTAVGSLADGDRSPHSSGGTITATLTASGLVGNVLESYEPRFLARCGQPRTSRRTFMQSWEAAAQRGQSTNSSHSVIPSSSPGKTSATWYPSIT